MKSRMDQEQQFGVKVLNLLPCLGQITLQRMLEVKIVDGVILVVSHTMAIGVFGVRLMDHNAIQQCVQIMK